MILFHDTLAVLTTFRKSRTTNRAPRYAYLGHCEWAAFKRLALKEDSLRECIDGKDFWIGMEVVKVDREKFLEVGG